MILMKREFMDLKPYIRDVPDFPKAGILFRDITPLLSSPKAFSFTIDQLVERTRSSGASAVVGVESRGFIFGAPVATLLKLPFVPVRKPGKLPAERMSLEYSLEYGKSQLDIHRDAVAPGQKVVIIDDLLATGGTAHAAAKLVELIGGEVSALLFIIELASLGGKDLLKGYSVHSLLTY